MSNILRQSSYCRHEKIGQESEIEGEIMGADGSVEQVGNRLLKG